MAPLDPERDAETISRWTHDPAYPLSAAQVPKQMEKAAREREGMRRELAFGVRASVSDALPGFVDVTVTHWAYGDAYLGIGVGERSDWGRGYGTDALRVMLHDAFRELNLHRVSLTVFEYNARAVRCYEKAGFVEEGRRHGWLSREGRRWDLIYMGILREEWERLDYT